MIKLISIDGPDDSGKTTLIKSLLDRHSNLVAVQYDKVNPDGSKFALESYDSFQVLKCLLNLADPSKVYIMDRGPYSNLAYGPRNPVNGLEPTKKMIHWLITNIDYYQIFLTRPKITERFTDDLLDVSADRFNFIIDQYLSFPGNQYNIINSKEDQLYALNKDLDKIIGDSKDAQR